MSKLQHWKPKIVDWNKVWQIEKILLKIIEEHENIPLTVEIVKDYHDGIKELKELGADAEITHILEDNLMQLFIHHLSKGIYNKITATKLSKEIKLINKTMDEIGRWYA
jgi:hypothetical protein